MPSYLITGKPASGKSTIGRELAARGFRVIFTDRLWGYWGDLETELPLDFPGAGRTAFDWYEKNGWLWDQNRMQDYLQPSSEVAFFCGGADNEEKFYSFFDRVFVLYADPETLRSRLQERPPNHTNDVVALERLRKTVQEGSPGSVAIGPCVQIQTAVQSVREAADEIVAMIEESESSRYRRSIVSFCRGRVLRRVFHAFVRRT